VFFQAEVGICISILEMNDMIHEMGTDYKQLLYLDQVLQLRENLSNPMIIHK
jgi:hypothetical protein